MGIEVGIIIKKLVLVKTGKRLENIKSLINRLSENAIATFNIYYILLKM